MASYPRTTMALGLCSNLLAEAGFRHAFFMRRGGVSPPPWESLNFSTASGDSGEAVATNLSRVARSLEVPAARIYFLSQVHGHQHRCLAGTEDRQAMLRVEGDITVSSAPQVGCAVRMADCPAVLVAHRESGSVAAIHSGWRGTVQHAVAAGVKALRDLAGDGPLLAAVGPHIESCCFEVGAEVAAEIAAASDVGESVIDDSRAKPRVDLRRVIDAQLRSVGVEAIDHVPGCTMCDSKRFHSYRRDGKVSGRMLAVIVSRGRA